MFRRALRIDEASFGSDHPNVAGQLNNLATLLLATNRIAEAELLFRRALRIDEASYGPDHPNLAIRLNNLAVLLKDTNRLAEAEPLMRRALKIDEASFGPIHPDVADRLNTLATILVATYRLAEAEPLMLRALKIDEASFGPNHPHVSRDLNNLALIFQVTKTPAEAEPLMRRSLAIEEASLGKNHPNVAVLLNNIAALQEDQGNWVDAITLYRRAANIIIGSQEPKGLQHDGIQKAVLWQNAGKLRAYTRALYHADKRDVANRAEGFELAQWALQSDAADALSAMAARFTKGGQELGKLVREQQDLLSARETAYRGLDAAAGKADAKAAEAARASIAGIEAKLADKQAALRQAFPDYAELAKPKPLPLAEAKGLLGEGDAMVLTLDLAGYDRLAEETIIFALTKKEARWISIGLGTRALREQVTALRCGLDAGAWRRRQDCHDVIGAEPNFDSNGEVIPETLRFDLARANTLYRELFGGIEDLIKDKSLLIVPSGALTQLPFEVLVTEKPDEKLPRFEAYKSAAWLGQRQTITILPSVGSIKALRAARASAAPDPFAGLATRS